MSRGEQRQPCLNQSEIADNRIIICYPALYSPAQAFFFMAGVTLQLQACVEGALCVSHCDPSTNLDMFSQLHAKPG